MRYSPTVEGAHVTVLQLPALPIAANEASKPHTLMSKCMRIIGDEFRSYNERDISRSSWAALKAISEAVLSSDARALPPDRERQSGSEVAKPE